MILGIFFFKKCFENNIHHPREHLHSTRGHFKINVVKTVANFFTPPPLRNACSLSRKLVAMYQLFFQSSCCETVVYVLHRKIFEYMYILVTNILYLAHLNKLPVQLPILREYPLETCPLFYIFSKRCNPCSHYSCNSLMTHIMCII